jgi:hypothetical protein
VRAVSLPALISVFPVYGVTGVVAFILNPPVLARVLVHVRLVHFSAGRARDQDGDVLAYLFAGQAVHFAEDAGYLRDVREIYLSCFRYPA